MAVYSANIQRTSPCGRVEPEANAGRKIHPSKEVNKCSDLMRKHEKFIRELYLGLRLNMNTV